ncbi:MAG: 50S ribosomal protein L11 methyltransferase [Bacteroidetes bacterium]|nr:50S ribosomal protein L11 methyltransferase [Bacteroidota bacterium]
MNHIEISISTTNQNLQDIIIATLAEINYEGFEQNDTAVKAFIKEVEFNETELEQALEPYQLLFTKNIIAQQNWNALWESNFDPVMVDDFVSIRANFHKPITTTQHQIIITPKMSFGTGHHATTYSVMQLMRNIDFTNKNVFDFGSGTGILAILAEKLGAKNILAVDYDDWCIENSLENIDQNNCKETTIEKADNANVGKTFDIVIANINKNIIQDNFDALHKCCKTATTILLSGLLIEDEQDILQLANNKNWKHITTINKGAWIAMQFLNS